ncbi:hypothetical protein HPB51_025982 [Rhipicephalus microplus]|uniref:THAP-type domain-containing protein n=1 Tax=Rhipicephalus microplus TaxID=6941 RepID=A0A9J6EDV2_RHIMP|nr:hypothetical protein HPB51_025982 [Rhipicephalus microplus]
MIGRERSPVAGTTLLVTCSCAGKLQRLRFAYLDLFEINTFQWDHATVMGKQQKHCFAPRCNAGYFSARKQVKKASLFSAPSDDERRKAWERAIPRADKPLEKNCVVCEAHSD